VNRKGGGEADASPDPVTFSAYPWHSQGNRFAAPQAAQHMKRHAETIEIAS
jgi:hypothetical protein